MTPIEYIILMDSSVGSATIEEIVGTEVLNVKVSARDGFHGIRAWYDGEELHLIYRGNGELLYEIYSAYGGGRYTRRASRHIFLLLQNLEVEIRSCVVDEKRGLCAIIFSKHNLGDDNGIICLTIIRLPELEINEVSCVALDLLGQYCVVTSVETWVNEEPVHTVWTRNGSLNVMIGALITTFSISFGDDVALITKPKIEQRVMMRKWSGIVVMDEHTHICGVSTNDGLFLIDLIGGRFGHITDSISLTYRRYANNETLLAFARLFDVGFMAIFGHGRYLAFIETANEHYEGDFYCRVFDMSREVIDIGNCETAPGRIEYNEYGESYHYPGDITWSFDGQSIIYAAVSNSFISSFIVVVDVGNTESDGKITFCDEAHYADVSDDYIEFIKFGGKHALLTVIDSYRRRSRDADMTD